MKNKRNKGITLIALVVTIIVLLILAGISIQMLTGDNGILKRAADSKEETIIEQIIENARLDIINTQLSKKSGIVTDDELETILTSKYGTLSTEEENTIDKTLTTTDGKYQIPVSKIYDGVFSDNKLERYKNEVDLYFTNKFAEVETNKLKLQEYFSLGLENEIYDYNTNKYIDIYPILDASTELIYIGYDNESTIMEYHEVQYRITYNYLPSTTTISVEPINREEINITDKSKIKEIIPDITDEYLNKLLIQNGELAYIPDNVNEKEKNAMEQVGILAMTLATIIFIANGVEFTRLYSDKIIFPNQVPIYTSEGYVFDGWYTDKEMAYSGSDTEVMWDYTNRKGYKAQEGQHLENNSVISLYATFKTSSFWGMCLQEKTKITLADGTKKNVEDVNYDDELLVWNFDEGKLDKAKPIWIMNKQKTNGYIKYKFENGEEINTPGHRIFNYDRQEFTEIEEDIDTPIGTTVFTENQGTTKLIAKYEIEEETNFYNIITNKHINLFSNGILTSLRFNSTYEIENMKFVKDDRIMNKNEDYPNIPKEYFDGLRLAEQKNTRRKNGEIWWKEEVENKILKNKKV